MGWFSKDKKAPEVSDEAKAKYAKASTDELKQSAAALREEREHPKLSADQHLGSLASGTFLSPESMVGNVGGVAGGYYLAKERGIRDLATEAEGSRTAAKALMTEYNPRTFMANQKAGLINREIDTIDYASHFDNKNLFATIGAVGLGALIGLNAYRRYNNEKRGDAKEKTDVELKFVETLLAEREQAATRPASPAK